MKKDRPGSYRCEMCGAVVEAKETGEPPLSRLEGKMRVVKIGKREIHRCQMPKPPPAA